jgi:hypothetical protein
MGPGSFPRVESGRGVTLTPHPLLVPRFKKQSRWEDNIKMNLQDVGGGGGDWMELAQDRDRLRALVSTVKKLRVPQKCREFLD